MCIQRQLRALAIASRVGLLTEVVNIRLLPWNTGACIRTPYANSPFCLLPHKPWHLPFPLCLTVYVCCAILPQAAREAGFNAVYGDGSRAAVLKAAGVVKPRAIAVCLSNNKVAAHRAVASLRSSFPSVPLFALGGDIKWVLYKLHHLAHLSRSSEHS